jgi:hypothetical protein
MQLLYALVARFGLKRIAALIGGMLVSAVFLAPQSASALPIFARQTGQNCLSCHAGGQFPELTPYGRMFKMTGYTIGQRTVPLAAMGVIGDSRVANTGKDPDPEQTFAKNGSPKLEIASVFIGGKITDNIGAFTQFTYDNYNNQAGDAAGPPGGGGTGYWQGHTSADNMDIRYADHFISPTNDIVFGVSLNNDPSVTDPWNTAPAWMQYVPASGGPGSNQFLDMNTPYPGNSAGSNVAGVSAYMLWNKAIYAELGLYRTANQMFSFMSAGLDNASTTYLNSTNPYWRLAYTHEWGPNNIMVGTSGMIAHVMDPGGVVSDSSFYSRVKTVGIDTQYQYLLDPHTITVQAVYQRQTTDYSAQTMAAAASPYFLADGVTPVAPPNPSDTVNIFRLKGSYVYEAKYGGSIAYFNQTSTTNTLNQTSGYDSTGLITFNDPNGTGITSTPTTGNLSGNLGMRGATIEAFWIPIQYVRVGAQYTAYSKFNGATSNYDGLGRNPSDNNTLFFYIWGAY